MLHPSHPGTDSFNPEALMKNDELFDMAQKVIPGGVNSPVRAFKSVGGTPVFIRSAKGCRVYSEEGLEWIDYVGSWGPMILGHAHPEVLAAVHSACNEGLSFGAPTLRETRLAEKLIGLVPSMEMVRFVSSGTEATMSAIRLARAVSGRERILKFEGCYHGHSDSLLVNAGSGALTFGVPSSPGVPSGLAALTSTLPYNDIEAVRDLFSQQGHEMACIIVEPVAGNMNCIPPVEGFLETLREVCDQSGSLLIFDEVMTGFRVGIGGAQERYGIQPDLTTLGKIIGGGMPVGAFGGRASIMSELAPLGPVYQAGTLSGNPVAMAAGLATLDLLTSPGFYRELESRTLQLTGGLEALGREMNIPITCQSVGGMFGLFFTEQTKLTHLEDVKACDTGAFNRFFHAMLDEGIYLAPSAFEAGFVSAAHGADDIDQTLEAASRALKRLGA